MKAASVDGIDFASEFSAPLARVATKARHAPNRWLLEFVQSTTLFVIATVNGDGSVNTSIRGGAPGFLDLKDAELEFEEAAGNMLFETAKAAQTNANVGLLLIVPGINEVVRIRGKAAVAVRFDPSGEKRLFWRIRVGEWYYHCGRALKRSNIFNQEFIADKAALKRDLSKYARDSDSYEGHL
jgi:hypothetical protein